MNKNSKIAIFFGVTFLSLGVVVATACLKDDVIHSYQAEKTYTITLSKKTNMIPNLEVTEQQNNENNYVFDSVKYPVTTSEGNTGVEMYVEGAFIYPDGLCGLSYNGGIGNAYIPNETYHGRIAGLKHIVVNYTGQPLTVSYSYQQDMAKGDYRVTSQPIQSGVEYYFDHNYPEYFMVNSELEGASYINDIVVTYSCSDSLQKPPSGPYYDSGFHQGVLTATPFVKTVKSNEEACRALEEAIVRHHHNATITFDYDGIEDVDTFVGLRRNFSHVMVIPDAYSQVKGAQNTFYILYFGDMNVNNDYVYGVDEDPDGWAYVNQFDVASHYTNVRPGNPIGMECANVEIRKAYARANNLYRPADFDDFAIDKRVETIDVYNSEDLWWAAQHGYKPTFPLQNSKAEWIYNEAKKILNSVITTDMTNYEKARAIFEWSVTNNEYDHDALKSSRPIQENTCFYLEGVFERRLAVCDGLSKSYVLLCQMEGLDVIRGVGFGKTGGHAWAYYRNNPNEPYYLICPTWGEGSYIIKNKDNTQTLRSFVSYDAFMTGGDYFYEQTKTLEPPSVYDDLINKDVNIASKKKYDPSIYTLDKLPGYTDYDYQIDTKDEFVAMVKEAYKVCDSRFSLSFMFGNPSLDGQMKAMLDEAGTDWNKYRLSIVPSTLYEATSYTLFFMD